MIPQLVIFDCDGVLVDSEWPTQQVLSANLARHGLTISPHETLNLFAGGSLYSAAEEAIRRGATLPDNWVDEVYSEIFELLRQGVEIIPGVIDLLDRVQAAGIAVAIASNGPLAKMEITLKPSGLWDRFAGRIYSGHTHGPKPQPDMLIHAMQVAGATAGRTVMIDDMPAGWNAATAAGVRGIAYVAEGGVARAQGYPVTPVTDIAQIAGLIGLDAALSPQG